MIAAPVQCDVYVLGKSECPCKWVRKAAAPNGQKAPVDAYAELARLVHYEHIPISLDDPEFMAALVKMDSDDRIRQEADFTLKDLQRRQWT